MKLKLAEIRTQKTGNLQPSIGGMQLENCLEKFHWGRCRCRLSCFVVLLSKYPFTLFTTYLHNPHLYTKFPNRVSCFVLQVILVSRQLYPLRWYCLQSLKPGHGRQIWHQRHDKLRLLSLELVQNCFHLV
jgi:hypothetical protein